MPRNRFLTLVVLLAGALGAVPLRAADEDPWAILENARSLARGPRRWSARQAVLTLSTTDTAEAPPAPTRIALFQRRNGDDEETAAFVREPAALAGHALLLHAHGARPSEAWRFDPARGPAEAVAGETLDAAVAGTPLTFRDLDLLARMWSWTPADADATLRGRENIDLEAAWAIELAPKSPDVRYRRIVVWIGAHDAIVREIHLVGTGTLPDRRIRMTRIRDEGAVPWIETLEIEARAPRRTTRIDVTDVRFNAAVPAETFTPAGLARGEPGS
ncbi:MAG: outer membrane lipoprotein-sorting protein [bacterium]|nr:outer membrane lipoprotein-sorting protein [bacterium]